MTDIQKVLAAESKADRYRLAWLSARRRVRWLTMAAVMIARQPQRQQLVEDALGRPLRERAAVREEIRAGLNSALCNGGHPESHTGWSPSTEVDRITDAVMAKSRPMPTRDQIMRALADVDGRNPDGKSEAWLQMYEETYGHRADAVLALIEGTNS